MTWSFTSFFAIRDLAPNIVEVHHVGMPDGPALDVLRDLEKLISSTLLKTGTSDFEIASLSNDHDRTASGLRVTVGAALMDRLAVAVLPHLRTVIEQCVRALHVGIDVALGPLRDPRQ